MRKAKRNKVAKKELAVANYKRKQQDKRDRRKANKELNNA